MNPSLEQQQQLVKLVQSVQPDLTLTMMEVGALPLGKNKERFYPLVELLPGSRVIAFELDTALCDRLNAQAPQGIEYYSQALGRDESRRTLYETRHPMCTSLYKPNEALLDTFMNLEVAKLKAVSQVDTVSMDRFVSDQAIGNVDFIKIDIQGAELDVFEGGPHSLKNTTMIVTEVEFIPLYEDQPLFGDVCKSLETQGLAFHKFLHLAGRPMRPIKLRGSPHFPSQHMWSDAVFTRPLSALSSLSSEALLKTAILSFLYGSPDVTYACLTEIEKTQSDCSGLSAEFMDFADHIEAA